MSEWASAVAITGMVAVWLLWRYEFNKNAELKRQITQLQKSSDAQINQIKEFGATFNEYVCFCEICYTTNVYPSADQARSNGWEIANGQQFCPEHRG